MTSTVPTSTGRDVDGDGSDDVSITGVSYVTLDDSPSGQPATLGSPFFVQLRDSNGDAVSGRFAEVTVQADGSFSYKLVSNGDNPGAELPPVPQGATVSFDYTATLLANDGSGTPVPITDTARVTVNVYPDNGIPTAFNDAITIAIGEELGENGGDFSKTPFNVITGIAGATDVPGTDPIQEVPDFGQEADPDSPADISPDAGYAVTQFEYRAIDGTTATATPADGTVIATAERFVSDGNGGKVGTGEFYTGNLAVQADGDVIFNLSQAGQDALQPGDTMELSFVYTGADAQGDFDTATATITVKGPDAPVPVFNYEVTGSILEANERLVVLIDATAEAQQNGFTAETVGDLDGNGTANAAVDHALAGVVDLARELVEQGKGGQMIDVIAFGGFATDGGPTTTNTITLSATEIAAGVTDPDPNSNIGGNYQIQPGFTGFDQLTKDENGDNITEGKSSNLDFATAFDEARKMIDPTAPGSTVTTVADENRVFLFTANRDTNPEAYLDNYDLMIGKADTSVLNGKVEVDVVALFSPNTSSTLIEEVTTDLITGQDNVARLDADALAELAALDTTSGGLDVYASESILRAEATLTVYDEFGLTSLQDVMDLMTSTDPADVQAFAQLFAKLEDIATVPGAAFEQLEATYGGNFGGFIGDLVEVPPLPSLASVTWTLEGDTDGDGVFEEVFTIVSADDNGNGEVDAGEGFTVQPGSTATPTLFFDGTNLMGSIQGLEGDADAFRSTWDISVNTANGVQPLTPNVDNGLGDTFDPTEDSFVFGYSVDLGDFA